MFIQVIAINITWYNLFPLKLFTLNNIFGYFNDFPVSTIIIKQSIINFSHKND